LGFLQNLLEFCLPALARVDIRQQVVTEHLEIVRLRPLEAGPGETLDLAKVPLLFEEDTGQKRTGP